MLYVIRCQAGLCHCGEHVYKTAITHQASWGRGIQMKDFGKRLKSAAARRWNAVFASHPSIIRTIHIVWVGDQSKRPDNWIETWQRNNPNWIVRVWGNRELTSLEWFNHEHISEMLNRQGWSSVADMMRWEILDKYGGFAVDADSICIRPLENWLFEPHVFACWENEIESPGLIANGYVYSHPDNPLIRQIIDDIYDLPSMNGAPFRLTGPGRLTETFRRMRYTDLTIYPSHYFIPTHWTGLNYKGSGPVFAQQLWYTTRLYHSRAKVDRMHPGNAADN
jgi:mannosyltransferase OCH1-like enzyme